MDIYFLTVLERDVQNQGVHRGGFVGWLVFEGFQVAAFSLCLAVVFPMCVSSSPLLTRTPIPLDWGPHDFVLT